MQNLGSSLLGNPQAPPGHESSTGQAPARLGVGSRFRGDVEGLRSVAVLLVVLYHAGVPGISGGYVGVDVFFVLSGFLITGLLLAEVRRTGRIDLARFYGRRARRLLPLATLVVVATVVATLVLVPPVDRPGIGLDVLGAALYAANWRYAVGATDYLGADSQDSPLLHFWSLGVEEQYYLVWPLLLLLVTWRGRGGWAPTRRRAAVGLALLGLGSLALSWWLTPRTGSWAYFGLHTRAWELAAGAGLALALPAVARLPRVAAALLGWTGLVMVLVSAFAYDDTTVFPGTVALLPVLGTVLVVAAGAPEGAAGTARLFAHPALRYVGRISYAWYLWHWPCLVLTRVATDGSPSTLQTAAAVLLSFVLAAVSHVLVENPVRHQKALSARSSRSLALGAALTVVGVAAALVLHPFAATSAPEPPREQLGVLTGSADQDPSAPAVPAMTAAQARADQERPAGCYVSYAKTEPPAPQECVFGDPDGDVAVGLVGDSHSAHWLPAFDALARERGWKLYYWGKSSCPPFEVDVWAPRLDRTYSECREWTDGVLDELRTLPPLDVLYLARAQVYIDDTLGPDGERIDEESVGPVWEDAARRTFADLDQVADRLVVVQDTPWAEDDVPACLSEHPGEDWTACDFPREGNVHRDAPLVAAEQRAAGDGPVQWLDMTDRVCPGDPCPVVADNGAVIYGDSSHFTTTFGRSAWPLLGQQLDALLGG